jgi:tetrahydromethanopterin S-methyltransferase subunit D
VIIALFLIALALMFGTTVVPDTPDPVVDVQVATDPILVGQQEEFVVSATDNVGVTALTLTVGSQANPLAADGTAFVTMADAGAILVKRPRRMLPAKSASRT